MRLVHVSDLHASQHGAIDRRAILQSFLDDVSAQHDQVPVEMVVFSGDIAFGGRQDEYALAKDHFLDPLDERLGLTRQRIILAPGNHDIDRDEIDAFTEEGLRQGLNTREAVADLFDAGKLDRYLGRLSAYIEFHDSYYAGVEVEEATALASCHRVNTSAGTVGLAALNTAWRATGRPDNADRGHLLLGERQLHAAIEQLEGCDLRVAVMHHPLDWLASFDADEIKNELERHFHLVLSGHLHEPDPEQVASVRGRCIYSRAGCLYDSFDYPNSYSLIDVDPGSNRADFLIRRYFPGRRAFDAAIDLVSDGRVEFSLQQPEPPTAARAAVERVPYNTVLGVLVDVAHETSVLADHVAQLRPRSVVELLVPPVFLPVPHEQAVAALEPGGSRTVDRVDILRLLADTQCAVVAGNPETGLTSSLLWILENRYATDGRLPVYLRFAEIGAGKDPVARALSAAMSRFPQVSSLDPPPVLVVAVDEVDPRKPKAFKRLIAHIVGHPDNQFVLGCHADNHEEILRALEEAGVPVERVFLGPFGRRELKTLARKFLGGIDRALVDRVLAILRSEKLPRTPFLMAALVVVLDAGDLPPNERSETAIIERYVDLLLGRVSPSEDSRFVLDFRNYEHILASFAEYLVNERRQRVSRLEAEAFLIQYWRVKGWAGSPSRVLDALIDRRMLIEDRDGVGFRHRALQHLFVAKQMSESEHFRTKILASPLEHSSAVRHAAALDRSDRDLLLTVGEVLARCLSELYGVDESFFHRIDEPPGWSRAPDLKQAARSLRPLPELPSEAVDEQMDELWENLEAAEVTRADREVTPSTRFADAVELLSSVLRSSELVDDVEVKERLLREAIRGWGIVSVLVALGEDQTNNAREMFRELFLEFGTPRNKGSNLDHLVERMVRLMVVVSASFRALLALGSLKMVSLIERTLDDDEFMSVPANAFFATFLAVHLTHHDRARRLHALIDRHGSNAVIRDMVRYISLLAYHREQLSRDEETGFENLLIEISLTDQAIRGGAERSAASNYLRTELRKSRIRAASRKELDDGDLLDVEVGPGTDEAKVGEDPL